MVEEKENILSSEEIIEKSPTKEQNKIYDTLLIATKVKKTIIYVEKILDNYPHKNIEIKSHISKGMYEMLEHIYLANNGFSRLENQNLCIVKLQLVDFYLMLSYKKGVIGKKKYESIAGHLLEIKKMLCGWKKADEKEG